MNAIRNPLPRKQILTTQRSGIPGGKGLRLNQPRLRSVSRLSPKNPFKGTDMEEFRVRAEATTEHPRILQRALFSKRTLTNLQLFAAGDPNALRATLVFPGLGSEFTLIREKTADQAERVDCYGMYSGLVQGKGIPEGETRSIRGATVSPVAEARERMFLDTQLNLDLSQMGAEIQDLMTGKRAISSKQRHDILDHALAIKQMPHWTEQHQMPLVLSSGGSMVLPPLREPKYQGLFDSIVMLVPGFGVHPSQRESLDKSLHPFVSFYHEKLQQIKKSIKAVWRNQSCPLLVVIHREDLAVSNRDTEDVLMELMDEDAPIQILYLTRNPTIKPEADQTNYHRVHELSQNHQFDYMMLLINQFLSDPNQKLVLPKALEKDGCELV